jgi:superfamily II DNA helicase RecQ
VSFAFFTIPVRDSGNAETELNSFLRAHKILAVERRWVDSGANSFWAICVDYLESPGGATGRSLGSKNKTDYKDVLKLEEFAVFAKLRDLRKEIAQAEAVPVYTIFTNEQLAEIVRTQAATRADLGKIEGIGDARVEKYGSRVLALLGDVWGKASEASGKPV